MTYLGIVNKIDGSGKVNVAFIGKRCTLLGTKVAISELLLVRTGVEKITLMLKS